MLHYHPTIELLTDYTSGALSLSHALAVSTHLERCSECQKQVRKLETLGAQLFNHAPVETQATSAVSSLDALKRSLFNHLDNTVETDAPAQPMETDGEDWFDEYTIPSSLKQFVPKSYNALRWLRLSPSVKIATLCNDEGSQVALTRIKAGAHIPTHTHTGEEITLVLEGAFSDEKGVYRQGDFILRDSSHKHKPMVTKDAECICLTVLDAPIEFTGWFTRLFNPILRRNHPHIQH